MDSVSNPAHYTQGPVHCIDAMVSAFGKHEVESFCRLNAFKYLWRSVNKCGHCGCDWNDGRTCTCSSMGGMQIGCLFVAAFGTIGAVGWM